jgi:hypothetical protein
MCLFKKRKAALESVAEQRFDMIISLIKDLPRTDFNKLLEGIKLAYEAYSKVKSAKTIDEKELEDIDEIEKSMKKEAK